MLGHNKIEQKLSRKIIAIILFYFLITFATSRLFVYLVLGHWVPNFFLTIKGVHIHHFTYGVVILVLVGLYMFVARPTVRHYAFKWATILYGIGLGLTFDEFGMWIRLEDDYWVRQSYDAIVIVTLLLLNLALLKPLLSFLNDKIKSRLTTDEN